MLRFLFTLGATFALVPALLGQAPSPNSPFVKKGKSTGNSAITADQSEELTLSGITAFGGSTLVCITLTAEKRSHWIKVGESAARIKVLSHNPANGQVTVRHGGQELTLQLKKPSFNNTALANYRPSIAAPLPSAGVALDVPMTNEQKEADARYLVSDLLEIGIIQREAYKKAEKGTAPIKNEKPN